MHRDTLANIDINVFELDTERKGVTVSVREQLKDDEVPLHSKDPVWTLEVEPEASNFVLAQRHLFITEATDSLVFTFESFENKSYIGEFKVMIDDLIKHGLESGTLWTPNLSPEKVRNEAEDLTSSD